MLKGPLTTQYLGRIVADQLSKMAATIIWSTVKLPSGIELGPAPITISFSYRAFALPMSNLHVASLKHSLYHIAFFSFISFSDMPASCVAKMLFLC